ncbi:hypothetical protein EYF80_061203 [Liparis tanakae]|uniref:Uncharacterized protein n=1 Tax=Liparis tanakae TaxID=230148 RepID=A0A4Z2EIM1_9TELE|nr:hypothetical protein EYF80_061203 [Liparis tanakae]
MYFLSVFSMAAAHERLMELLLIHPAGTLSPPPPPPPLHTPSLPPSSLPSLTQEQNHRGSLAADPFLVEEHETQGATRVGLRQPVVTETYKHINI